MKEKKVYLIDLSLWDTGDLASDMSDGEWKDEAKFEGNVYSIQGFEDAYNEGSISTENTLIRIL